MSNLKNKVITYLAQGILENKERKKRKSIGSDQNIDNFKLAEPSTPRVLYATGPVITFVCKQTCSNIANANVNINDDCFVIKINITNMLNYPLEQMASILGISGLELSNIVGNNCEDEWPNRRINDINYAINALRKNPMTNKIRSRISLLETERKNYLRPVYLSIHSKSKMGRIIINYFN